MITKVLESIDNFLYAPILIIIMAAAGLYFTVRTRFVQLRLFGEACKLIVEPPAGKKTVSSFQALMVSTASRVGTGNIVGVATAICLGGAGSVFWMWVMCIIGAASAFMESTLAQIFKRVDKDGGYYGGPAYYIEMAMHSRVPAFIFSLFLILTYAFGFNLLASYNLQSTFMAYSWYGHWTKIVVGAVLALLTGYCLMGGGKRIVHLTEVVVPVMGILYVLLSLLVLVLNIKNIPAMFVEIFTDAFNFKAIFGGIAGSCLVLGIKRGLFSNEAGVGSAPNASASADVSHPVKQGLVQSLGVFIETIVSCSCTAFILLVSGVDLSGKSGIGIELTQSALSSQIGPAGSVFITIALFFFAFSTVISTYYYGEANLRFFTKSKTALFIFRLLVAAMAMIGTCISLEEAWELTDICMGVCGICNLVALFVLCPKVIKVLDDYVRQRKAGIKSPTYPDWWDEHKVRGEK